MKRINADFCTLPKFVNKQVNRGYFAAFSKGEYSFGGNRHASQRLG